MTVLYFSSTGNSLYLAKRMGGNTISIPYCIENEKYVFEDSEVGMVFPDYGLCVPPFIVEFIEKLTVKTDYFFSVVTYGFFPGAVCGQLKEMQAENGRGFDYINRIKMGENCVTFSDMAKSKGDSEKQQKDIAAILEDIGTHRSFIRTDSTFKRFMTKNHQKDYEFPTGKGITDMVTVNDKCKGCGICTKVCPMRNIRIEAGHPVFGEKCVSCGACLQHCPQNAMHHIKEKSPARYRNPHVRAEELMYP